MTEKKKSTNHLTHIKFFKLCEAIKANVKEFKSEQTSYEAAAARLSTELGFTVVEQNVTHCARQLEMAWLKKGSKNAKGQFLKQFYALSETTRIQGEEIKRLRYEMDVLLKQAEARQLS